MSFRYILLSTILILQIIPVAAVSNPHFIHKPVNFGHKKAYNRTIDVIIIHSVYNASGGDIYDVDLIIKQFAKYKVSPHYLIDRQGNIYRMVKDNDIAYQFQEFIPVHIPWVSFSFGSNIAVAHHIFDRIFFLQIPD